MSTINFVQFSGEKVAVEVTNGESVMLAAVSKRVPGILGECGGSLACATCHVFVDEPWLGRLKPASDHELEMLDATATARTEHSRLACQILASDELDGMTVRLPEAQI